MESSDLISYSVRVKKEPSDVSPSKNICEIIDEKPDLQNLPFPPKNSTHILQKCDKSRESELDDELEIVVKCEDIKDQSFKTVKKPVTTKRVAEEKKKSVYNCEVAYGLV
ncbi:hypothetical protein TKK_0002571 [Trichogramma kaykai]